jgi:hypothetical protein
MNTYYMHMYTVRTCIIPNLLITSLVPHVGFAIGDGYLYFSTVYVYHIIKMLSILY